jgi:HAD superfamily hydrolase (TIGR01490 family)
MKLALFDFDGTIINRDSLLDFIRFAVGDFKFFLGLFLMSPILVLLKLKLMPNQKVKEKFIFYFFKNFTESQFKQKAEEYSLSKIEKITKKIALDKLNWHKQEKHKIVIVSASVECWLKSWCEKNGFEVLSTKLKFENQKLQKNFLTPNCYGQEKVNRIKEKYNLADFEYIYAYGDSRGDYQMLNIADERYFNWEQLKTAL